MNASLLAAVLVAGAGAVAFHHFPGAPAGQGAAPGPDDFTVVNLRSAMVGCREAAQMTYDVQWAAACQAQANESAPGTADGHAECDLPDARAAVINAWLNEAERRCTAEGRS
ncbi:hypothetical protein [Ramlibacter sp. WS9]|uniref:hypothetical protein n=1 Tax=Ramlibacter sp. WS9 TaxID=1882741 RepID=UPI0011413016|nr:hypothetical protein [Ramlibacter sp. WS9]